MTGRTTNLTLIALFAAILAVSSFLKIPVGPVPLTLQSTAALLTGYVIGPSRGASAVLLYTAAGLAGLPIFATGGGPAYILAPTFGFIIGFTLCAFTTGLLARFNTGGSALKAYFIMLGGLVCLYLPGFLWLCLSLHKVMGTPEGISSVIRTGLIIPFAGDILKTIPAAYIGVRLRKNLSHNGVTPLLARRGEGGEVNHR
jgi:biotin transport system substrate-specific component